MIIRIIRYNHDKDSTQGLMFIDGEFTCHTLEDEERCKKVHGETRIPEGTYQVKLRNETTPLTEVYRKKYPWFTYHLQIMNVPGFKWVYIHVGNFDDDTEGCLLVGDGAKNDPENDSAMIQYSRQAFERIYQKIRKSILDGEEVWISIEKEGLGVQNQ